MNFIKRYGTTAVFTLIVLIVLIHVFRKFPSVPGAKVVNGTFGG